MSAHVINGASVEDCPRADCGDRDMKRHGDYAIDRADEAIRDAVRFLAPREAVRILREVTEDVERLARKYEDGLLP